jgi:glycosyltransferase involved in cell wall biosynthesis
MASGRLRIALIAPPWYPIPPQGYGGTELVVALLTAELRARGHEVVLFGLEGSPLASHPVAPLSWAASLGSPHERLRDLSYALRVLDELRSFGGVDLVHDHTGGSVLLGLAQLQAAPVVHTVHGSLDEPTVTFLDGLGERVGLVAISRAQRESAARLGWLATVHNAVDIGALLPPAPDREDPYLLSLARVCHAKGQHVAIEVARRASMRLVLAGKVETPDGVEYFERCIRPHVDGRRVVHLANVAGAEKARLLAGATALLAPLQWDEPFGLYMAEAMASGTPVIAFPRGAAPELVSDGVTGFLVDGVEQMAAAVALTDAIDREACARLTRHRFHPSRMADQYLGAYHQALSRTEVARPRPGASPRLHIAELDGTPAAWRSSGTFDAPLGANGG